jgi:hypothetical protein
MEKPVSVKARKKFENADGPSRKKSDDEIDWIHYNIIHHIDHALPDVTTAQGSYYEVTAKDFESVVAECKNLLSQLSISIEDEHIFDDKILTQAILLGVPLKETRIMHKRHNIGLRTDAEMLLADEEYRGRRYEDARERYRKELEILSSKR